MIAAAASASILAAGDEKGFKLPADPKVLGLSVFLFLVLLLLITLQFNKDR